MTITFTVIGTPVHQGSKVSVTRPNGTRWVAESGGKAGQERHRSWRAEVTDAARAVAPAEPLSGPVSVHLRFRFLPVASDPCRTYHVTSPDLDKICRAVLDSLKVARVLVDDSRVAVLNASKLYCRPHETPGVTVTVDDMSGVETAWRVQMKRERVMARKKARLLADDEREGAGAA